jgi:glycosyltransferase involved in cell wall biosynthesis
MTKRAVSICTYNRANRIGEVIAGVLATVPEGTDVFVCDDGSVDGTRDKVFEYNKAVHYYRGPNLGVAANKNRALYLMQNHHFSAIIEDDLVPTEAGWFELYEGVSTLTDIHHFCRIQDKVIPETSPAFTNYLAKAMGVTPIYATSPRGDFTFLTRKVITTVGGLNPMFRGVGYAHGEWSARVVKAGLVSHSSGWIDIAEARDKFKQIGDTEGGRWKDNKELIDAQLKKNRAINKLLKKKDYLYCPLELQ